MTYFWTYYVITLIYCLVQLFRTYFKQAPSMMDILGRHPEFDAYAIVFLCWIAGPVDLFLRLKSSFVQFKLKLGL